MRSAGAGPRVWDPSVRSPPTAGLLRHPVLHSQRTPPAAQDSRRGRLTWRRNTATSWRSTRISTSFERALRASSPSQETSCRKTRYSSRIVTAGDHSRRLCPLIPQVNAVDDQFCTHRSNDSQMRAAVVTIADSWPRLSTCLWVSCELSLLVWPDCFWSTVNDQLTMASVNVM